MASSSKSFKVSFTLDETDARFFRTLFDNARKRAAEEPVEQVVAAARKIVEAVRAQTKVPTFVSEAIETLEDLVRIVEDKDWEAPKDVQRKVVAALAYFSHPEDLIPDNVPVLGFLDDAIVIKVMEEEFRHELAAYRTFSKFRDGAEQRPWTAAAKDRLPTRLRDKRDELRAKIRDKLAGKGKGWLRL
jgi:uncharacterized membrane protein YkvA (DUF1232 family)